MSHTFGERQIIVKSAATLFALFIQRHDLLHRIRQFFQLKKQLAERNNGAAERAI